MSIAVTGSIATDYLMTFPGTFTEQFLADELDHVSLSFLIDRMDIHSGGVAANICFGLAGLGLRPVLVGAVGKDYAEERARLEALGVDTESIYVSEDQHTSRFLCTTDLSQNQIASFYAGAMSEARNIELAACAGRVGELDPVLISPNDPEAMLRHTQECRERGYRFLADPGQQVTRMEGPEIRELVDGAAFLFTNEYERSLLLKKTGWSSQDVLDRVDVWLTTLGPGGARWESNGADPVTVPSVPAKREVDPTGIGDAFRVGFVAGLYWKQPTERAMQLGCMLATTVLEAPGPQEYEIDPEALARRIGDAYGDEAAADIEPFLRADG
ncbi:MAG: carbohydrate kinase family protein [Propionibacteriales bacterium]|nr:carbohydrate kinase family protein [Propionibacteriales bacterium]